jgi:hypothetical protein
MRICMHERARYTPKAPSPDSTKLKGRCMPYQENVPIVYFNKKTVFKKFNNRQVCVPSLYHTASSVSSERKVEVLTRWQLKPVYQPNRRIVNKCVDTNTFPVFTGTQPRHANAVKIRIGFEKPHVSECLNGISHFIDRCARLVRVHVAREENTKYCYAKHHNSPHKDHV